MSELRETTGNGTFVCAFQEGTEGRGGITEGIPNRGPWSRRVVSTTPWLLDARGSSSRNNRTKSLASDAGNVSEPRLTSQVGTVLEVVCA